jgi:competence protein ComGC
MKNSTKAFTRSELLAICAAIALLALAVAPVLATNKSDSERLLCFNNLRLIGRAVQMWAGDHNQQPPARTLTSNGGLMPDSGTRPGRAWADYSYISNQLGTPKILACPSDTGVRRATDFGSSSASGLLNSSNRDNAVSYVVGLEAVGDGPRSWLSGDRNLGGVNPASASCSARVNNANSINTFPSTPIAWTNGAVHGEFGHVLLMDGSVEFTSTPQLKALLIPPQADDNGSIHFLRPR